MREIKFRAYLKDRPMEYFGLHNGFPANWSGWNTTMQFTGLLDKNGKEIFEGDIVRTIVNSEYGKNNLDEEVIFGGGAFYPISTQPQETWEVIGNVWENPELLKGA